MIKIENLKVFNIEGALRGMRNALESWDQSDSYFNENNEYIVGEKDRKLAHKLIRGGPDHGKFMRQILVSMVITAPMTWWWDFDTYKIATVRNSTSRMHKLGTRLLTMDDFSTDDNYGNSQITELRKQVLEDINNRIMLFQELKEEKKFEEAANLWRSILFDLPPSYNFLSAWTGNYENIRNIYHARKNHKQREFKEFCEIVEKEMPCSDFITIKKLVKE